MPDNVCSEVGTVPRGERPLEYGDSALLRFAADLRRLRAGAGQVSYRELAARSHYSTTTLSDAAGGRKLPTLDVTLAYVRGCRGDEEEWRRRWHEVAAEVVRSRPAPADSSGAAPYVGLSAFQPEDAKLFFGRDTVVEAMLARLERQRFVALFGASGEGKSSVLRAGLLPAIRPKPAVLFTPGPSPIEECAIRLAALTQRTPGSLYTDLCTDPRNLHRLIRHTVDHGELLMIVDQFEEIFTLCQDKEERSAFVTMLLTAAQTETSRARVVLGVRADFYPHCARHPELVRALTDAQLLLGAMTTEDLRQAIIRPAVAADCAVETALVAAVVGDAGGRTGALPFVSHALLETWRRRRGNTLTLSGYHAAGGISSALAQTADAVFDGLTVDQQSLARQLFLRLTALGEGTEDTKRRITRDELDTDNGTDTVLQLLAGARLITLGENTVEITHEALFRAWPKLQSWLSENRDGLRTHRQLTEAAKGWDELGRDPGTLYRGTRLTLTVEWATRDSPSLTARERAFLDESIAADRRERQASRRRARQLRWVAALLAVLLIHAVAGMSVAIQQRDAVAAASLMTQSHQLAALAAAYSGRDDEQCIRSAVQAYQTYPTVEARSQLLSAAAHAGRWLPYASISPDGTRMAVTSNSGLQVLSTATLAKTAELSVPLGAFHTVPTFSPDGRLLVVSNRLDQTFLWDTSRRSRKLLSSRDQFWYVVFSPDSTMLATIGPTITVWDTTTQKKVASLVVSARHRTVAFAPDNKTLAVVGELGKVELWDVRTLTHNVDLASHAVEIHDVVFASNGDLLAAADAAGDVTLWDTTTGKLITTAARHEGGASAVAFRRDGKVLASAGADGSINLWDVEQRVNMARFTPGPADFGPGDYLGLFGLTFVDNSLVAMTGSTALRWNADQFLLADRSEVRAVEFGSGNDLLAVRGSGTLTKWGTGPQRIAQSHSLGSNQSGVVGWFSADRTLVATTTPNAPISVWETSSGRHVTDLQTPAHQPPTSVVFSADSRSVLAIGSDGPDLVWSLEHPDRPTVVGRERHEVRTAAVFLPDKRHIVLGSRSSNVIFHEVATGRTTGVLLGDAGKVIALALSPDGTRIATGNEEGVIILWDVASRQKITELSGHTGAVTSLAFSPDGSKLASGSADTTTTLWDTGGWEKWATLAGRSGPVEHVAWSPRSNELITLGADHGTTLWRLDTDAALRTLSELGRR